MGTHPTALAGARARSALLFGITIFWSAFLLFQVELIAGKFLLPWFGGASAVWATSLVFFQLLLLAGYAYSHYAPRLLGDERHAVVHAGLVLASAVALLGLGSVWVSPITPDDSWKPDPADNPVLGVFALLGLTVGAPFLLLSTSGPLLQRWFAHLAPGAAVYRLYAVSNAGSLLGLLLYPFLVEPWLRMQVQGWAWAVLYVGFAIAIATTAAVRLRGGPGPSEAVAKPLAGASGSGSRWPWLVLPMFSSMLLLATTNVLCAEVAVIPLLWILPLTIYLLSWILAFESDRFYSPRAMFALMVAALPAAFFALSFLAVSIYWQFPMIIGIQLVASMWCHGELKRREPPPSDLTLYYLLISTGSALGGLFVALGAPVLFAQYLEFPLALVGVAAFLVHQAWNDPESWLWTAPNALFFGLITMVMALTAVASDSVDIEIPGGSAPFWLATLVTAGFTALRVREGDRAPRIAMPGWVALWCASLLVTQYAGRSGDLVSVRNFYGIVRVREIDAGTPDAAMAMEHGRTTHGMQLRAAGRENTPTTYYGPNTGVGVLLGSLGADEAHHIGAVGLGVGTLAAWARPGDAMTFYEINPAVIDAAVGPNALFTFARDSRAEITSVLGDGRLSLERELRDEGGHAFDVLVLDAFSGDSIPVHLLTVEAFGVYLAHLAPDGVLALHISNRNVDLEQPVAELVRTLELHGVRVDNPAAANREWMAEWVLVSRDAERLAIPEIAAKSRPLRQVDGSRPWTDDYSNIVQILR